MGLSVSAYRFLSWWMSEYLYFIALSSYHCIVLGHETMKCAVSLAMYLCSYIPWNMLAVLLCFVLMGLHCHIVITVTSWWARWRLKWPASWLFTQPVIQRKHQTSASLVFVRGIHRWPVNSPHKGPVTRKCFHLMTSSWAWIHLGHLTIFLSITLLTLEESYNSRSVIAMTS